MGDDRGQHPGPGGSPSRGGRTGGSSVLTPPTGVPTVPEARMYVESGPAVAPPAPVPLAPVPPVPVPPVPVPPVPVPLAQLRPSPSVDPVPPAPVVALCRCGHGSDAHEHWRRGSDCGACGAGACAAYRPPPGALRRLLERVGLLR